MLLLDQCIADGRNFKLPNWSLVHGNNGIQKSPCNPTVSYIYADGLEGKEILTAIPNKVLVVNRVKKFPPN